jgi:predicted nucleic acid-binding protein
MLRLVAEGRRLVTTYIVLIELHALLVNRVDRHVSAMTIDDLRASQTIVRPRPRDEARAYAILAQHADKDYTLADTLSFAVMERLGIRHAFAFDQHFVQFGWQLVQHESD